MGVLGLHRVFDAVPDATKVALDKAREKLAGAQGEHTPVAPYGGSDAGAFNPALDGAGIVKGGASTTTPTDNSPAGVEKRLTAFHILTGIEVTGAAANGMMSLSVHGAGAEDVTYQRTPDQVTKALKGHGVDPGEKVLGLKGNEAEVSDEHGHVYPRHIDPLDVFQALKRYETLIVNLTQPSGLILYMQDGSLFLYPNAATGAAAKVTRTQVEEALRDFGILGKKQVLQLRGTEFVIIPIKGKEIPVSETTLVAALRSYAGLPPGADAPGSGWVARDKSQLFSYGSQSFNGGLASP